LSEGRLVNLACNGHPSFVMSASFTIRPCANRTLDQAGHYDRKVYTLPKHLDEKVAALHLDKIGVKLTTLTTAQRIISGSPRPVPLSRTITAIKTQ